MTRYCQHWCCRLGLASWLVISGAIAFSGNNTLAQLTPDTTLGSENSTVTSTGAVDSINGGATRGTNLFHSFGEFNVEEGRAAYFNNPAGIENILSRITGANPSNIFGTLGVVGGNANLFLINPNGIIFGANARLDVGGSFVGTTANAIGFGNQGFFSATNPSNPSLLTVNPSALLFNQIRAASIKNNSVADSGLNPSSEFTARGLRVPDGKSLLLVGGDINMDGGGLYAFGGRVELGGSSGAGTVGLNVEGSNLRLRFPDNAARTNVSLTNAAEVNVRAENSGSITINADNLNVLGESFIFAGIREGLGSVGSQVGDITLNVTGAITVADSSGIYNNVGKGAIGDAGNINIKTGSLLVTKGSRLSTNTFGRGNGGSVNINARDSVSFDGVGSNGLPSAALSNVEEKAIGDAGNINIKTGSLWVTNGAQLESRTRGQGDAGSVNINASDNITFEGVGSYAWLSGAYSSVETGAVGKGGNINITTTGSLSVINGAQLQSLTRGQGDAGSVNINARDSISFDGVGSNSSQSKLFSSAVYSTVTSTGKGKAGNINITTTGSLSVTNGAQLQSLTRGQGDAGSVNINARDSVSFDGVGSNRFSSAAYSSVETGAVGKGGNINITTTGSLSVTNGARLQSRTRGQGDAGSVNINARDSISFDGVGSNGLPSAALSNMEEKAIGDAGNINIKTGSLWVTNGAQLSSSTFGQGDAGSVNINARDNVFFNRGFAFNNIGARAIGNSEGINITAGSLWVTNGAQLSTSIKGKGSGNAGSVNINAHDNVSFDGIFGNVQSSAALSAVESEGIGKGGDINITGRSLWVTNGAYLSASTFGQGDAGSVNINARDSVSFNGVGSNGLPSAAFSTVETTAVGDGKGINITTDSLSLTNGAYLSASTRGEGDGGNITLNISNLEAVNGGQVLTTSRSSGKAGSIIVNATGSVTLSGSDPTYFERLAQSGEEVGEFVDEFDRKFATREQIVAGAGSASGLFASTFKNSTGQGGGLTVTSGQIIVENGAQVSVSSEGTGTSGNLTIDARSIRLNNNALLSANTRSATVNPNSEQATININSQNLLMRRGSNIRTNAEGENVIGGNININSDIIAALENSDIRADSANFRGGNVRISAQGIFGTQLRDVESDRTSDITATGASPEFSGNVELNTPDTDLNSGLVNLPTVPINTEMAQTCTPGGSQQQSEFVVTGRGGLPQNPGEALNTDAIQVDLVTLAPEVNQSTTTAVSTSPTSPTPTPIVEAQGWAIAANGEVILTANANTVTPHNSWQNTANCRS
ncbi:filamentous hemagglutinin N-terminal domain-containing protein [Chroococcidiopsis sp. CCNUC1]|uniref:two-partner secretion domain-containing protein n=1 Tax=Chroococcidiopsis sp. CCNUC1 TaxID=2653189 RepID=UPI0020213087|nr:filamentous hemagglutinin N-terminal domain-containing protein [Chroococcidiopsis sp. CCNUC1]URD48509.1 filamentous hemagglutinin N-terminal domain-containing protein [Chroococcidiopsis sp. CCNUC1]